MDNKTDILISGYIQIINYPDTRIFVSIPTEYLLYLAYLSTATLYNSVCDKTLCVQDKLLLAASNDFASRIWTSTDQRLRVRCTC